MTRAPLPSGIIPVGATHFYFDPARRTPVTNPWRRLEDDGTWHMMRGDSWGRITGTSRHKFFSITEALQAPPSDLAADTLTLRDYFAAKAMSGIFANESQLLRYGDAGTNLGWTTMQVVSEAAYMQADAMLAARSAKP